MSAFDSLFSNAVFAPAFGASVTYSRGASEAAFTAMDSKISTDRLMEYGASLTTESREFIFLVSDLELGGVAVEPEPGDRITDALASVWEVREIGQAPCWEFDADRNYYRVRTVLIGN